MLLNKFKTKKVETVLTAGECLKRKREELNISIKDVSEKINIKISYLKNLENSNYEELPPDVYVRGFIKSYAQFVGIDSEKMAEIYNREKNIESKIGKKFKKKENHKNRFTAQNYAIITPKIVVAFFSLCISLLIGYYLWHQINSFSSTPYLFISSPLEDQIVNNPELIIEGETEEETVIKINGQSIFVNSNGYFKESITLQPGANIFIIEAINKFDKTAKEIRSIIYEKKLEPPPVNFENSENENDNAEIEYTVEVIGP